MAFSVLVRSLHHIPSTASQLPIKRTNFFFHHLMEKNMDKSAHFWCQHVIVGWLVFSFRRISLYFFAFYNFSGCCCVSINKLNRWINSHVRQSRQSTEHTQTQYIYTDICVVACCIARRYSIDSVQFSVWFFMLWFWHHMRSLRLRYSFGMFLREKKMCFCESLFFFLLAPYLTVVNAALSSP